MGGPFYMKKNQQKNQQKILIQLCRNINEQYLKYVGDCLAGHISGKILTSKLQAFARIKRAVKTHTNNYRENVLYGWRKVYPQPQEPD